MIHYVLLKFEPDSFTNEVFEFAKQTYTELMNQAQFIRNIHVEKNCVVRNENMDIMIELEMTDRNSLELYLGHTLHKQFTDVVDDHVVKRVSFDYMTDHEKII